MHGRVRMTRSNPSTDVDQIITNIVFGVIATTLSMIAIWQGLRLWRNQMSGTVRIDKQGESEPLYFCLTELIKRQVWSWGISMIVATNLHTLPTYLPCFLACSL